MDTEFFSQRVTAFQKRIASLFDSLQSQDNESKAYIQESFIELAKALEELETAEEELNVQATELEQFRVLAQTERENYLGLLQFCPEGYLITDTNGVIRVANPAACRMLKKAMAYLIGKPLVNWIAESDRRTFRSRINQLQKEGAVQNFEMRVNLRRQSSWSVYSFTAGPVRDALGEITSIRWLLRDTRQFHEVESGLEAYQDRFRAAFQAVPFGIQLLDKNGFSLDANAAAQRILGYDQDALKHLSFVDYVVPQDLERLVNLYTRLSHKEIDRFRLEVNLLTKTRGVKTVRLSIVRYKSPGDPAGFAIATMDDSVEQNGNSHKPAETQETAIKNSLVLRQSMAQELRTGPLEDLVLILHRLENISQPDPDQSSELDEIRMALQDTIAKLTEKVNDLSASAPVSFDLHEAVVGLMQQIKWGKPALNFTFDYDPVLNAVPEDTRLALFNIFSAIIQYRMRQGNLSFFEIHAQHNQDTVVFEIQDDGPGENVTEHPEALIREGQFEFAQAMDQAEALHGHIASDGELNSSSTIRIVVPWKKEQGNGLEGNRRTNKHAVSPQSDHGSNKTPDSKMEFEAPASLPDKQQVFYIPYDKEQKLDKEI